MKYAIAAAVLVYGASVALAQTTPANPHGHTPAVATSGTVNPSAPVAGENSFTETQARSRIEAAGYSGVSGLTKDKDGVWRGQAVKAGTTQMVSVDFQGNVTSN